MASGGGTGKGTATGTCWGIVWGMIGSGMADGVDAVGGMYGTVVDAASRFAWGSACGTTGGGRGCELLWGWKPLSMTGIVREMG